MVFANHEGKGPVIEMRDNAPSCRPAKDGFLGTSGTFLHVVEFLRVSACPAGEFPFIVPKQESPRGWVLVEEQKVFLHVAKRMLLSIWQNIKWWTGGHEKSL